MANPILLSRCVYVDARFTRFEPLLEAGEFGWRLLTDRLTRFPDDGRIFSVAPETLSIDIGTFWTFPVEQNQRYDPLRKGDRFLVANGWARPAIDVVDLSAIPVETARRRIVEEGIDLSWTPVGPCVILLQGGICIRIALKLEDSLWRWRPGTSEHPDRLETWRIPLWTTAGDAVEGRMFLMPPANLVRADDPSEIDWSSDIDFLPRVVKRLRRIIPARSGLRNNWQHLTRDTVELLAMFLDTAGLLPRDTPDLRTIAMRVPHLKSALADNLDRVNAIVDVLETLTPIDERIRADIVRRRSELETELRAELEPIVRETLESGYATLVDRMRTLREEIGQAIAERDALTVRVSEIRAETEDFRETLVREVEEVRGALAEAPKEASVLARRIARRLTEALGSSSGVAPYPPELPPWTIGGTDSDDAVPVPPGELSGRLDRVAAAWGVNPANLVELDALARAGEFVILQGRRGRTLLDAYAHAVAAGRLYVQLADPVVISADDLWRQPGSGSPTAFAHAWTAARNRPGKTFLFVFDRLQSSPVDLWLPSLPMVLGVASRPANLLVTGLVDGPSADSGRTTVGGFGGLLVPPPPSGTDGDMAAVLRAIDLELGRGGRVSPGTLVDAGRWRIPYDIARGIVVDLSAEMVGDAVIVGRAVRITLAAMMTMSQHGAVQMGIEAAKELAGIAGTRFETGRKALAETISSGAGENGGKNA